jgi:hypothetical protein
MKTKTYILLLSLCCLACNNASEEKIEKTDPVTKSGMAFDKTKWNTKSGTDYPFRNEMLTKLRATDTLRHLKQEEIIALLGLPDRMDKEYLFYKIEQKHIGILPLQTKTLVIKLSEKRNLIMIHE